MRFTLPKSQILRGHGYFSRVLTRGKSVTFAPVRCAYLHNPSGETRLKVGFAVSRHVSNATIRNQLKRKMREEFRTHKRVLCEPREGFTGSLELVLVYTHGCDKKLTRAQSQTLSKSIIECLSIVGKRCRGS